jgi:Flp pilus assembly secretin CpaC
MADGNILMVGGENGTFASAGVTFLTDGKKGVRVFNNELSEWELKAPITTERWYPTVATLADGSSIIIGGSTGSFDFDKVSP